MAQQFTAPAGSPWHSGERSIHERMGNAAQLESFGRRVIRDYMPDQHRDFYKQLPFMVIGALDAQGQPWASLIEGQPGFMHSPEPTRLEVGALPGRGDPVRTALRTDAPIGLLGIELHSRRRNRLNGRVLTADEGGFSLQVGHAFGNCPQYIQHRDFSFARPPADEHQAPLEQLPTLDAEALALIAAADTFFVASAHPGGEADHPLPTVDVSHRGGKPGFVKTQGTELLRIPDFAGNMHFNTFGNLLLNPRAGLVFVDFSNGDVLQLAGEAQIQFEGPEIAAFQGAERIWTFRITQVLRRRGALALRWALQQFSPNSLMTGSWEAAEASLAAAALSKSWRPFKLARVVDESSTVRSFYLEPADGHALLPFLAGQHLPIRVNVDGVSLMRTYTLSAAPSDGFYYRLSIKRGGRVSEYLHDRLKLGELIEARAPQGDFTVDALERRPLVLLAGGIGVTPLLSMLRHVVFEGLRKRRVRPTYFFYSTRNHAERGFDAELAELVQRANGAVRVLRVTDAPEEGIVAGRDFDVQGRIDMALLKAKLPFDDHDFFLCGPPPFMQALYDGLRDLRVSDERIHAEAFGPASMQRRQDAFVAAPELAPVASSDVAVQFAESSKEARWTPASGSLLELAEARGLNPEFSCRGGSCGSCRTQVLEGEVTYLSAPAFKTAPGEALICCAMPAAPREQGPGKAVPIKLVLKL
ncbi:FAD-binding oxidoreductase [Roseateles oligotrophus]|uniref:Pyridoxamine 5'-phosphate oxidase family protein n=1 Tax=Roseateles oligotrophus TaxID=1769250 RepID=A0ABT2YE86_9BURK|nr:pyridoxamine 5'-phosphate oxidase family protein [Roseateles oligotrophus]MCV2368337.1 pyridoxamine 5'-phosphate oxidase family protein [Roseateles oligotrophus]